MTCPRSGRGPSGPACGPRKLDADSAALAAHLSQGRDAETSGVRGRRDAFGLIPAPGCRGPEAGADPADLRVGEVHSSHAHAGGAFLGGVTRSLNHAPRSGPPTPPVQECTCADFPLGGCAGDARHLLANVRIPVPPAPATFLGPVALTKARACLGCWDGLGRGAVSSLHVWLRERPEEALQWATTRWLWGALGPLAPGTSGPGRACAGLRGGRWRSAGLDPRDLVVASSQLCQAPAHSRPIPVNVQKGQLPPRLQTPDTGGLFHPPRLLMVLHGDVQFQS